ncbi:hypothetical protein [Escherichia coli]|uniref:hypothetical protein n=1 Tax=Escherichia coli TaxID=562 RepID=UPI00209B3703|nr:hypothetical protein [Escherichia coli]
MTLDQLLEIHDRAGLSTYEQETIISFINQRRGDFGVKALPEIMPPVSCGWISRRTKQRSQEQADENSWNYYKQKIQEWITLIELHEASLTRGEKLKRFMGKHKWWLGGTCAVIASITSTVIASWILSLWTWAN